MKSIEDAITEKKSRKDTAEVPGTVREYRLKQLEEKVDQILKYSKKTHRWIMVKGIIGILMFIVFVVLPIVGTYYLWDFVQANVDLGQIVEGYQSLNQGFGQLNQLNGMTDILNNIGQ